MRTSAALVWVGLSLALVGALGLVCTHRLLPREFWEKRIDVRWYEIGLDSTAGLVEVPYTPRPGDPTEDEITERSIRTGLMRFPGRPPLCAHVRVIDQPNQDRFTWDLSPGGVRQAGVPLRVSSFALQPRGRAAAFRVSTCALILGSLLVAAGWGRFPPAAHMLRRLGNCLFFRSPLSWPG